jgi:hypothetical protein
VDQDDVDFAPRDLGGQVQQRPVLGLVPGVAAGDQVDRHAGKLTFQDLGGELAVVVADHQHQPADPGILRNTSSDQVTIRRPARGRYTLLRLLPTRVPDPAASTMPAWVISAWVAI